MPTILDTRQPCLIYDDVVTMGLRLLAVSDLNGGGGGGGTVTQGPAGLDPWLVSVSGTTTVSGTVAVSNAFALESTQLLQATAAKQDTGNTSLASVKTNTDPLVTAGGGGYIRQDSTFTMARETGGNLATIATNSALQATSAKQDTGNTSLATIAGKDFATSAKQDTGNASLSSIDGKLTSGIVISTMPPVTANSSADVLALDGTAGYTDGATGQPLTQTTDGRLRVAVAGLVSEVPQSYLDNEIRSLSMTTEGRLRVSSVPANTNLEMFRVDDSLFFEVPHLAPDFPYSADVPNNPWGF